MHLQLKDRILPLGQIGPDFILLKKAIDHPPTSGRLFLAIDGNEREWDIYLPQGMSAQSRMVAVEKPK